MSVDWVGIAAATGAATGLFSVLKDFVLPRAERKEANKRKTRDELLTLLYGSIADSIDVRAEGLKWAGQVHRSKEDEEVIFDVDIYRVDAQRTLLRIKCAANDIDISEFSEKANLWKKAARKLWVKRKTQVIKETTPELIRELKLLAEMQEAAANVATTINQKYS